MNFFALFQIGFSSFQILDTKNLVIFFSQNFCNKIIQIYSRKKNPEIS
jgi:hypothetical protein